MILLAIDIQKGITDNRLYNFKGFIENTRKLLDTARKNGVEVIYFQHDYGPGTGFSAGDRDYEIADEVKPIEGEKIYSKNINSCFGNENFKEYVKKLEDKTIMIVGLMTNYCIDATVKSAFERGFKVIIPEGANTTSDNDYMNAETTYRYYNEMMWPKRFAECISMEDAINLLERK
ncbi:MAG: isochorismatase family protein [Lachnospiraceae bacterium]|nr:isochorismatase family protein [Lachnospiraceae bacterium]